MDENTKHIVASNLTAAYCANRPHLRPTGGSMAMFEKGSIMGSALMSEEEIVEIYRKFVGLLDATPAGESSSDS